MVPFRSPSRVVLVLVVGLAAVSFAGCGSSSEGSPAGAGGTTSQGAAPVAEPASSPEPTTAAITLSDARTYAEGNLKEVEAAVKEKVSEVGTATVECAPGEATTPEGQYECLYEVPFRRLEDCGKVKIHILVAGGSDGAERVGEQTQETEGQICYVGANGEPVPEMP